MSSIQGNGPNAPDLNPSISESQLGATGSTQLNESFRDGISSVLKKDSDLLGEALYRPENQNVTTPPGGAKNTGNPFFSAIPMSAFFQILAQIAKERSGEAFGEAIHSAEFMAKVAEEAKHIGQLIMDIAKDQAEMMKNEAIAAFVQMAGHLLGTASGMAYASSLKGKSPADGMADGSFLKAKMAQEAPGQIVSSGAQGWEKLTNAGITLDKGAKEQVKKLSEDMERQFQKMMQSSDERQRQLHDSFGSVMQLLTQLIQASTQASLFNQRG
ncbi:MAG: hypothetical protein WD595_04420 [Waddliaceae bacterium]